MESAILSNPDAAKCAVVGYPHEIKGTGIYAFVVLKDTLKDTGDIDRSAALPLYRHLYERILFFHLLPRGLSGLQ